MVWEKLKGKAKMFFDEYKVLPWVRDHHLDALARGCIALEKLDELKDYELSRYDNNGKTERKTPEAMEVNKLTVQVDNFYRDFGLTPYSEARITKTPEKSAKESRKTRTTLRKAI